MKLSLRTSLLIAVSAISLAACDTTVTQADLDNANATIAALTGQVSELTSNIAELDAQIAATQAALDAATAENAGMTEEIASLNAQLEELAADKATLENQLAVLQAQVVNLAGDNADLEEALANAEAALDASDADYLALQADLEAAQAAYSSYNKDAFNNLMARTTNANNGYLKVMAGADAASVAAATAANSAAQAALVAAQAAQAALTALNGAILDADTASWTLGQFYADDRASAEAYAAEMGLDPIADAAALVDHAGWVADSGYVVDLADLTADTQTASNAAQAAQQAQTAAEQAYAANYGGIAQSAVTTLYDASGAAVRAEGAVVYTDTLGNTALGEAVPVGAQITTLFLADANGVYTDVLVWEANDGGNNPFTALPVGAASYQSDNMVAYFAKQDGAGTAYSFSNETNAGTLTIDFSDNSGVLNLNGTVAGEFVITADLTFDPATGTFVGAGQQTYTSTAGADTATTTIDGNLWGAADTFSAVLEGTDTYDNGGTLIDVHLLTAIAGNGTVTLPPQ